MKIFRLSCVVLIMFISLTLCFGCGKEKDYKASINDDDVIKLTLFTYDGKGESHFGLMNLGHTFLSLENLTDEDIAIGKMTLSPQDEIALGTWSVKSHFGVWYNLEGNYSRDYRKYDGRISVSIGVSLDEVKKINEYISENDHWSVFKNCSYFALNLYNLVASDSEYIEPPLIYTPAYIASKIKLFPSYETNKVIHCDNTFGYFDDDKYIEYSFKEGVYEGI